jgi:hypothetical protein
LKEENQGSTSLFQSGLLILTVGVRMGSQSMQVGGPTGMVGVLHFACQFYKKWCGLGGLTTGNQLVGLV